MDIGLIANVITGLLGALLAGAWARTAAAISRNGREVSELRGQIQAMQQTEASVLGELSNAHRRIGGVARTADSNAGELKQMRASVTVIQQTLLNRGAAQGAPTDG